MWIHIPFGPKTSENLISFYPIWLLPKLLSKMNMNLRREANFSGISSLWKSWPPKWRLHVRQYLLHQELLGGVGDVWAVGTAGGTRVTGATGAVGATRVMGATGTVGMHLDNIPDVQCSRSYVKGQGHQVRKYNYPSSDVACLYDIICPHIMMMSHRDVMTSRNITRWFMWRHDVIWRHRVTSWHVMS